ncbi:cysteine desulfurase family protein [Alkalicoccus chagannorensis]
MYLDHAAGAPMPASVIDTWVHAQQHFAANPSSLHEPGNQAARLLTLARKEIAAAVGGTPTHLFFTAGGTEANHLALEALTRSTPPVHAVTTTIEHPSVRSFFKKLEGAGTRVTWLSPASDGVVTEEHLAAVLEPETSLVSVQFVNSETGIMQPVRALKRTAGDIPFHTDAVQALGKVPLDLFLLGVEALSVSAHKIGGPKHMGAVCVKDCSVWTPAWPETSQELGFRPGTVDVPGAAAFAAAVQALPSMETALEAAWTKRERFIQALPPETRIDEAADQSPYIIGLRIAGIQGQYLLALLDRRGISVSTGTACTQGVEDVSPVMEALHPGSPTEQGRFLRVSFGPTTSLEELERAAEAICAIVESVRGEEHGRENAGRSEAEGVDP